MKLVPNETGDDMYALLPELAALFGGNDVLVVVDDWRGADSSDPKAPIFFMGRSFYRRDYDRLNDLVRALRRADARGWHASARRAMLFRSPLYREVVDALDRCRSEQYAINHDLRAFDAPHLKVRWDALRAGPLGTAWTSDEPHAKALYLFLDRLGHYLNGKLAAGLQVRIVVDRLDWHSASSPGSLAPLGRSVDGRVEAFTVVRKQDAALAPLLDLLGLVDSEVWAWGRLQTRKLSVGGTVREHMLDWRDNGQPAQAIAPSEYEALFAASPRRLTDYWHRWVRWNGEGRGIVLHERRRTVP